MDASYTLDQSVVSEKTSSVLYPVSGASCYISLLAGKVKTDFSYVRSGKGEKCRPVLMPEHITKKGRKIPAHYVECGDGIFSVVCGDPSCKGRHLPEIAVHHGGRLACPECKDYVAGKMAEKVEERELGMAAAYEIEGINPGREKHIVFSPDQDGNGTVILGLMTDKDGRDISSRRRKFTAQEIIKDGGEKLKRHFLRLLKEAAKDGFYAGTGILHLQRMKCLQDGVWKPCEDQNCQNEHIYRWGPHFHYAGYGYFGKSNEFHERTGWIYKRIRDDHERSIFLTVRYLLTHSAGFEARDEAGKLHTKEHYSYLGGFARQYGGLLVTRRGKEVATCDICEQPKVNCGLDLQGNPDFDDCQGFHEEPTKEGIFYVRLKDEHGNVDVYPELVRDRVRELAEYRRGLKELKDEQKAAIWTKHGLITGDNRLICGLESPGIGPGIDRASPSGFYHPTRYRPKARFRKVEAVNIQVVK